MNFQNSLPAAHPRIPAASTAGPMPFGAKKNCNYYIIQWWTPRSELKAIYTNALAIESPRLRPRNPNDAYSGFQSCTFSPSNFWQHCKLKVQVRPPDMGPAVAAAGIRSGKNICVDSYGSKPRGYKLVGALIQIGNLHELV
ncbi:hypothetical protein Lbir_2386 [Legionella birminghamensis]|uniref:Uncharacterized protein n=1 Tax=Legionella birminghamensis TaxID=28083 RepID=A0A378IEP1_9GAMM|nr:hypothetical protein Lbir_2386 [Legionella birminghamensis]STX33205.1 Uncharacterised protein [Legionella birminghamensis]